MTTLSRKIVLTRKEHKCFACSRKFEKGTSMKRETNTYEGEIYVLYTCKSCFDLMEEFEQKFIDEYEGWFPEGCVTEQYYNYKVTNPEDLLMKLREQKYELGRTKENRKDIKG